jgi:hypothetical protein
MLLARAAQLRDMINFNCWNITVLLSQLTPLKSTMTSEVSSLRYPCHLSVLHYDLNKEASLSKHRCSHTLDVRDRSDQQDFTCLPFVIVSPCLPRNFRIYSFVHVIKEDQGVTRRCRLSWLTNSALVYESKCGRIGGGRGGVVGPQPINTAVQCAHYVTRSPNKLWRSNSIHNLRGGYRSGWQLFFFIHGVRECVPLYANSHAQSLVFRRSVYVCTRGSQRDVVSVQQYEPKCGGGGVAGSHSCSQWIQLAVHMEPK